METAKALDIGRYTLHGEIASGGMASVHFGRLKGSAGFSRTVAIKRLHPQFAADPMFAATLVDEARLVSRIRHPNVVPILDVAVERDGHLVVMEYVHGVAASGLLRACKETDQRLPAAVAVAIIDDVLRGLHAAHEARAADGTPLCLIHRDVSPQNILVTGEGVALITDFGIAKAAGTSGVTRTGEIKGKLAYLAPEQLHGESASRLSDVYAAALVLWELLTGSRLFAGASEAEVYAKVIQQRIPPIADLAPQVPAELEAVVRRALSREPSDRYSTALEMATAVQSAARPAPRGEVARWVQTLAGEVLEERAAMIAELERTPHEPAMTKAAVEAPPTGRRRTATVAAVTIVAAGALTVFLWLQQTAPAKAAHVEMDASSGPLLTVAAPMPPVTSALPPRPSPTVWVRPPPAATQPAATVPCRKLGSDGIWRIERCPVK